MLAKHIKLGHRDSVTAGTLEPYSYADVHKITQDRPDEPIAPKTVPNDEAFVICEMPWCDNVLKSKDMGKHVNACLRMHNCRYCRQRFGDHQALENHVERFHRGTDAMRCGLCNLDFETQTGHEMHNAEVHDDTQACIFCPKRFWSNSSLITHALRNHNQKVQEWRIGHYLRKQKRENDGAASSKVPPPPAEQPPPPPGSPPKEGATATTAPEKPTLLTGPQTTCPFPLCNKITTGIVETKRHMRSHMTMFQCRYCPKKYTHAGYLSGHVQARHMGKDILKCDTCPETRFRTMAQHERHDYDNHNKEHKCGVCETTCETGIQLAQHMVDNHFQETYNQCKHDALKNSTPAERRVRATKRAREPEAVVSIEPLQVAKRARDTQTEPQERRNHERKFPCPYDGCDVVNDHVDMLVGHLRTSHMWPCRLTTCKRAFATQDACTDHETKDHFACPARYCNEIFATFEDQYRHGAVHLSKTT